MKPHNIKVLQTSYREVENLLKSDVLRIVEDGIAVEIGLKVLRHYSVAGTSDIQSELSLSGMTVAETEKFLQDNRDMLMTFGIRFLRDPEACSDDEEYPAGEEPDPSDDLSTESETHGLGGGFGIKYAIFLNFLMNRTPAEFGEFLKVRRIPHHAKFAKDLRRIVDDLGCSRGP